MYTPKPAWVCTVPYVLILTYCQIISKSAHAVFRKFSKKMRKFFKNVRLELVYNRLGNGSVPLVLADGKLHLLCAQLLTFFSRYASIYRQHFLANFRMVDTGTCVISFFAMYVTIIYKLPNLELPELWSVVRSMNNHISLECNACRHPKTFR